MIRTIMVISMFLYLVSSEATESRLKQDKTLSDILGRLANEKTFEARARAAKNLRDYENPQAIDALLDALSDESGSVRLCAGRSLHSLTGQFFGFVPSDPLDIRKKAIERWRNWWNRSKHSFAKAPDRVRSTRVRYPGYKADIERLVTVIETEPNAHGGDTFIEVFSRIGADAVVPLSRTLKSRDYYVRSWGARALGKTGDKSAVPHLLEKLRLNPEDMDVIALGWLRDERAVRPLIVLLTNENEELRRWTCRVLGWIGDGTAVESLRKTWMTDSDAVVRSLALVALARLGYKDSIPALISTLESGWSGSWEDFNAHHMRLRPVDEELRKIVGKEYKCGLKMTWKEVQEKAGTRSLWEWWEENKNKLFWDRRTGHFRVLAEPENTKQSE